MSARRATVIAAAAALVVAGCGSHGRTTSTRAAISRTAAVTATATVTQTSSAPATTTPARTRTPAAPAGGPVPAHFDPADFTAVSASEFWLLGTAPCSHPACTSLVRTTDGGRRFVGLPAPAAPLGTGGASDVSEVRFATPLDGYVVGTAAPEGGPVWQTRDGGEHWQRTLGHVLAFDTSAGVAYALTGQCAAGRCRNVRLMHSHAGSLQWATSPVPVNVAAGPVLLTAHGATVWVSLARASGAAGHQTLLRWSGSASAPSTGDDPCVPGLGGALRAVSSRALWAVCATGTEAGLWRSTDAGAQWTPAQGSGTSPHRPALANSAQVAPADAVTAVLAPGDGRLYLTTDGGRLFRPVLARPAGAADWTFLGFTDPATGSGLLGQQSGPAQLWRTSDGGVHWHGPVRIG